MTFKILQIGKFYPPYAGGVENILKDICDGLAGRGNDVRVICSASSGGTIFERIGDVEVYRYSLFAKVASQTINPTMYFQLAKHIAWADIVHIHTPNPVLEFLVALLIGKKVLVTTHHSDIYRQKYLKKIYWPFWLYFLSKVTRITVPTINHLHYSDMIDRVANKVKIIPFGMRIDKFNNCSEETKEKNGDKYFLFVGRLVEYKGLEYLIAAMKEVKSKLLIVGRGPLEQELKQFIEKNRLSEKIQILTSVNDQELCQLYRNAYAFVLPSISKNENFGIVQLEAMFFSLPIITTKIRSGVPAVGIPGETTILVEPCSVPELANALIYFENNHEIAASYGAKGRELFEKKYSYDLMIESHMKLYKDLYEHTK